MQFHLYLKNKDHIVVVETEAANSVYARSARVGNYSYFLGWEVVAVTGEDFRICKPYWRRDVLQELPRPSTTHPAHSVTVNRIRALKTHKDLTQAFTALQGQQMPNNTEDLVSQILDTIHKAGYRVVANPFFNESVLTIPEE